MPDTPRVPEGPWLTPLFGLRIHHMDDWLVVCEKPPGLLMHRTHPRPQGFLQDLLRRELWDAGPLHVVHRLDRETSGLAVLARGAQTAAAMNAQFKGRKVAKRYLAVAEGILGDGECGLPIGPASGSVVRKKRWVAPSRVESDIAAKTAKTIWRVLERGPFRTLLEVIPEGGRQHQIRVHLAHAGHPLVGDKLYGPDERWHLRFHSHGPSDAMHAALDLPRHALHASHLAFKHPVDGRPMRFDSPLPDDLHACLHGGGPVPDNTVPLAPKRANA